jgi:hypothetical protein
METKTSETRRNHEYKKQKHPVSIGIAFVKIALFISSAFFSSRSCFVSCNTSLLPNPEKRQKDANAETCFSLLGIDL